MNCVLTEPIVPHVLQLEVRDLTRSEVCFKGRVGSTVNNALHVAQHSNGKGQQKAECAAGAGATGNACICASCI